MRIGEALRLVLQDVDLTDQVITVRDTKFFKTRLVPIGPKLNQELVEYVGRTRRRRAARYSRGYRAVTGSSGLGSSSSSQASIARRGLPLQTQAGSVGCPTLGEAEKSLNVDLGQSRSGACVAKK
jgi:integrase